MNLSYLKVKTFYMLLSGSNYKLRELLGREFVEDAEQLVDYLYTCGAYDINSNIEIRHGCI